MEAIKIICVLLLIVTIIFAALGLICIKNGDKRLAYLSYFISIIGLVINIFAIMAQFLDKKEINVKTESVIEESSESPIIGVVQDDSTQETEKDTQEIVENSVAIKKLNLDFSNAISVILDKTAFTYNGNPKTPHIKVQIDQTELVEIEDYTISYSNNIKVGTASVIITGIGKYLEQRIYEFKIIPKGTSIKKITANSKGFIVEWKNSLNL